MNPINRVEEAILEIKKGNMVIMLDDEDRENEGDLVYCSSLSTPEHVNFMATHAKGLICVAVTNETAQKLELSPMVQSNTSSYETAFTVSVDCAKASTGISAKERDDTIKILANPISKANQLVRPGHIFPLIRKEGGVLIRTGHTEGSIDLCKLAGLAQSAVICEIMKDDGTMARRDDLDIFADKHNLKQVYISDLVEYRLLHESLVTNTSTKTVDFHDHEVVEKIYQDHLGFSHTVLIFGEPKEDTVVKFHSIDDDINIILNKSKLDVVLNSIEYLKKHSGIFIFLQQNDASNVNMKEFGVGAQILNNLGVKNIRLLTNSKNHSFVGIKGFGLTLIEEIQV